MLLMNHCLGRHYTVVRMSRKRRHQGRLLGLPRNNERVYQRQQSGGIEACRRGGLGRWHPGNRERERVIGDRRHVLYDREGLLAARQRAFGRADGALGRWTEAAGWPSNAGDPEPARCATLALV
ncbi:hypothetical protein MTO96_020431 [Rhipicephalus appendiculatus]